MTSAEQFETGIENATCPVCCSEGMPVFTQRDLFCGLEGEFGQRRCGNCGLFFLSPRVPESQNWRYYPNSYQPCQEQAPAGLLYKIATALGLPFVRRRIVERFVKSGKILDVGCGNGFFLQTLEGGGWERYAMDTEQRCRFSFLAEFYAGRFDHEKPPLAETVSSSR